MFILSVGPIDARDFLVTIVFTRVTGRVVVVTSTRD